MKTRFKKFLALLATGAGLFGGATGGRAQAPAVDVPHDAGAVAGAGCCGPGGGSSISDGFLSHEYLWGRVDVLFGWTKESRLPPLVTAGPVASGAVLGRPGVTNLLGDESRLGDRFGGRVAAGMWLDDYRCWGLEGGYHFLGGRSQGLLANDTSLPGTRALGRPFVDAVTGLESVSLDALPGALQGGVAVKLSSRFHGWSADLLYNVAGNCNVRLDLIGGFRYLELNEGLQINESTMVPFSVAGTGGTTFRTFDQVDADNRFYGGTLGLRAEWARGRFTGRVEGKAAIGATDEVISVQGSTTIFPSTGGALFRPAGLLATATNIGRHAHNEFTVIPEASVQLGVRVTESITVTAGYSYLYSNHILRAADQVDRTVNVSQTGRNFVAGPLTGPARPMPSFNTTDFWVQGISLGLEFRY